MREAWVQTRRRTAAPNWSVKDGAVPSHPGYSRVTRASRFIRIACIGPASFRTWFLHLVPSLEAGVLHPYIGPALGTSLILPLTLPRLITFGGLSVKNGTLINGVANPRSRLAILAVLAVAGDRGVRREKLSALFWPESNEERARNALRQALFIIRRDIGANDITIGVTDLRLNPAVLQADVVEFDDAIRSGRFEDAATLYGGSFLDGVYLREAPEFERWVEEQRQRLAAEYGRALEKAATAATERGDARSAIAWWERRVALDPLSGRVASAYMEALVQGDEREQAIRHAATHARLVQSELESDPDSGVLDLAKRLRAASVAGTARGSLGTPMSGPREPDVSSRGTPMAAAEAAVGLGAVGRVAVRRVAVGLVAVGVVAVGGALIGDRLASADGVPVQRGLVAVGSFENRTGDSTMDVLAEQAWSGIAHLLAQSPQVDVVDVRDADTSSTAAEFLLRGHLDRRRDSVVAIAEILDSRSGRVLQHVVAAVALPSIPGHLVDEFRERVGGAVVAVSDTLFPMWREGRSRPPRYAAYLEFRQGMDALVQQGERQAIQHLVRAIELDPAFAQAKLWFLEQAIGWPSERTRLDSVRSALEAQRDGLTAYDRAATDRQFAFLDGRLEDTYTAARQMVTLSSASRDAQMLLAQAAMATRRFREALSVLHSLRDDPGWTRNLSQRRLWDLQAHRLLGDLETGITEWRRTVVDTPDDWAVCSQGVSLLAASGRESEVDSLVHSCGRTSNAPPNMDGILQVAGHNYRMRGHAEAADRAFQRALTVRVDLAKTDLQRLYGVAVLHVERGEWRAAYEILRSLRGTESQQRRVTFAVAAAHVGDTASAKETIRWLEGRDKRVLTQMDQAFIQLALGQREQALVLLRAAVESGVAPAWNAWYVRPELRELRGDPRFEALIRPR